MVVLVLLEPLAQLIWLHCASRFGIAITPAFVAFAAAYGNKLAFSPAFFHLDRRLTVHKDPIAGKTVQHRLKLTAAVASGVLITPLWTLLRLLTIDGKLPIRMRPALTPALDIAGTFISVASWTGSSFAKTIAEASFVEFFGSLR